MEADLYEKNLARIKNTVYCPVQEVFKLRMLDAKGWGVAILLGLVPLIINESIKRMARFRKSEDHSL